jgi:hypothetical protein
MLKRLVIFIVCVIAAYEGRRIVREVVIDDDREPIAEREPVAPRRSASRDSCGIRVRVVGGDRHRVELEFANVSDDSAEVGPSMEASFVDRSGAAMRAEMPLGEDLWFMPIHLPGRSHVVTEVNLTGGDASELDRAEIPNSGGGWCTIRAEGLATH